MEEETKESSSQTPVQAQTFSSWESKKKFPILPIIVILILIGLVAGGYFLLGKTGGTIEATPSPTPISEVTPSPTPAMAKEDVKIQVLNGTGVAGEAGKAKDKLTAAGYTNVETGNADTKDNKETTVSFSETVPADFQDEIITILEDNYATVNRVTTATGSFEVVIVTGLRKGATSKPTASSTPKPSVSPTASPTPSPTPTPTATP
ncbi:LytR C-terminal domain-containing protein [Candidatus Microgenomates bacterium]|nr:LytR C-terminal domain-containing protein [Candidatus Microgenomates bacterium]